MGPHRVFSRRGNSRVTVHGGSIGGANLGSGAIEGLTWLTSFDRRRWATGRRRRGVRVDIIALRLPESRSPQPGGKGANSGAILCRPRSDRRRPGPGNVTIGGGLGDEGCSGAIVAGGKGCRGNRCRAFNGPAMQRRWCIERPRFLAEDD